MKKFIKFVMIPIAGTSLLGVYYSSNLGGYYVWDTQGGYINNYELFQDLNLTNDSYDKLVGFSSQHSNQTPRNISNINNSQGQERIKIIEDYSIKLVSKCGSGTGWFLDYEIPATNKYPKKWFIATNAHVISNFKFDSNPYKQVLPNSMRSCVTYSERNTPLFLFKETSGYFSNLAVPFEKSPEYWSNDFVKLLSNRGRYMGGISNYGKKLVATVIQTPKLFYVPVNFLGNKYTEKGGWRLQDNYYKDFAVLEINFENEDIAKAITDNFYEKYKSSSKNLNLFSPELTKNNNIQQLNENTENYFVAGYPANSYNAYRSFGNYSPITGKASKLSYLHGRYDQKNSDPISVKNKFGTNIIGHVDVGMIDNIYRNTTMSWGGRIYKNWGYNYLLNDIDLGPGSSGALVTNSKGEVLGLYRMHSSSERQGFVEPLRSEGIYKDKQILYPKYDLINGASGQIGSYKDQLRIYYPNLKTMLNAKNWQ